MTPQAVIQTIDPAAFPGATPAQWALFTSIAQASVSPTVYSQAIPTDPTQPSLYDYALALYTAHLLATGLPDSAVSGGASANPIKTMKVGGVSIGYQSQASTKTDAGSTDNFLSTTKWGRMFQALTTTGSTGSTLASAQVL